VRCGVGFTPIGQRRNHNIAPFLPIAG
jgi:hypothetical protein